MCSNEEVIPKEIEEKIEKEISLLKTDFTSDKIFEIQKSKSEPNKWLVEVFGNKNSKMYGISALYEIQPQKNYPKGTK